MDFFPPEHQSHLGGLAAVSWRTTTPSGDPSLHGLRTTPCRDRERLEFTGNPGPPARTNPKSDKNRLRPQNDHPAPPAPSLNPCPRPLFHTHSVTSPGPSNPCTPPLSDTGKTTSRRLGKEPRLRIAGRLMSPGEGLVRGYLPRWREDQEESLFGRPAPPLSACFRQGRRQGV